MAKSNSRVTVLEVLAWVRFGSLLSAAPAVGVHYHTLRSVAHGCATKSTTRIKIEAAFGMPLERLQRPIMDELGASR